MPMRPLSVLIGSATVSAFTLAAGLASAQPVLSQVQVGTSTLGRPLYLISPTGDARRFVVEQRRGATTSADIRILLPNNTLVATPFLTVTGLPTGDEQGLLGLAFHPNYASNGTFYVSFTNSSGTSIVREHTVSANPDVANATARRTIITVAQDFSNHNGGWIAFGPDGFLYFALGDGGSGNDPNNRAQTTNTLLGKMLRLDVDGADNVPGNDDDDGVVGGTGPRQYTIPASNPFASTTDNIPDEIWSLGLRNPWRNAFDRVTGDLWIADVGQNAREEINRAPAGVGGQNFQWRCFEGDIPTPNIAQPCNLGPGVSTPPVFVYNRDNGCSVTGGFVYRGCQIPGLYGWYLYGDYCSGNVWGLNPATGQNELLLNVGFGLTSFGQDASGELYYMIRGSGTNGRVHRIIAGAGEPGPTDCNNNGTPDLCEIRDGLVADVNNDRIPDSCQCLADFDGSGFSDSDDFVAFVSVFTLGCTAPGVPVPECDRSADFDNSGFVDSDDFTTFVTVFTVGC